MAQIEALPVSKPDKKKAKKNKKKDKKQKKQQAKAERAPKVYSFEFTDVRSATVSVKAKNKKAAKMFLAEAVNGIDWDKMPWVHDSLDWRLVETETEAEHGRSPTLDATGNGVQ